MQQLLPIRPFSSLKISTCVIRMHTHIPAERIVASQTYIEKSKAPLLIDSCKFDEQFPLSFAETADKKLAVWYPDTGALTLKAFTMDLLPVVIWCVLVNFHLAALRPSCAQSNATVKAAKEGAFKATVEWLIKYL
jgi:hypothetical protein